MKIVGIILLVVLGAVGAVLGYLVMRKPEMAPASQLRVEATPERLARGEYLFTRLAHCDGCHSERDWTKFAGPVVAGGRGKGVVFPPELGLPGQVAPPNITPDKETGIGAWTDGEKLRAIRDGVSRDGRALFPMMPYPFYRHMSDEDAYSIIAYLNSLTPIRHQVPPTKINFPVNLLIKSVPKPAGSVPSPDRSNALKYGEYLVTTAACMDCHTQMDGGELDMKRAFAGGREFAFGKFVTVSANITSDETTGIGAWNEKRFVDKFRGYQNLAGGSVPPANQTNFTLMPWIEVAQISDEDLHAIYTYLKTVKAVYNPVDSHPAQPAAN